MDTVTQRQDILPDAAWMARIRAGEPLPPPRITPLFAALAEEEASRRGLPPGPWPA
jgi:hypothetical protein